MPEDRQAEYLQYLDDSQQPPDVWDELDATTKAWIEARYQERVARLEAQRQRWQEQQAQIARLDAETEKLLQEMNW